MLKRSVVVLVFLSALLLANSAAAASLKTIDSYIVTKEIPEIEKAISLLDDHLAANPADGEALWLMAKAHLYLGDEIEEGKLAVFEAGKEYAEQAIEILPESADAHYWLAALIGRAGQTRGILSSLFMVRPMKDALDRTLELDDTYADAYWVLSQLYHQAPGFPLSIGSKKHSLENAKIAVSFEPDNVEFLLQLAKSLDYNGEKEAAIATLNELLGLPGLKDEPKIEKEVREFLEELTK
ncbi:MAG TPA: hypothetical protein GX528_03745 [Firmicutes bacterium]|nr:hypothetical protein [Bacillota bacterium]